VEMRSTAIPSHRARDAYGAEVDRGIGSQSDGYPAGTGTQMVVQRGWFSGRIYYRKTNAFTNC